MYACVCVCVCVSSNLLTPLTPLSFVTISLFSVSVGLYCQKFYFSFRFEGFVNKINYSLLTNKQFQFFREDYLT